MISSPRGPGRSATPASGTAKSQFFDMGGVLPESQRQTDPDVDRIAVFILVGGDGLPPHQGADRADDLDRHDPGINGPLPVDPQAELRDVLFQGDFKITIPGIW